MSTLSNKTICLASGSPTRAALLHRAGVSFVVEPPNIDETALRNRLGSEKTSPVEIAEELAKAKALKVSPHRPDQIVLAADQILSCDQVLFTKPETRTVAEQQLMRLSGMPHYLHSAATLALNGQIVAAVVDTARMIMRPLSKDFIRRYLDNVGEAIYGNVGAYALEGLGAQLFDRIDGDFFTILGLPLLPVLGHLRHFGVIPE